MDFKVKSFVAFIFFFTICKVYADEVPTILWNIKGNALPIKPVSALEQDDRSFTDKVDNLMNEEANILVFAMNKLSSEDFSASDKPVTSNSTLQNLQNFLDTRPYVFMSSVSNPLSRLHEVHCGVQEIVVDQNVDENVLQSISLAFGQSCVVILHITDSGVFGVKDPKPEDIKRVFLPNFVNSAKSVVAIFTADKSSWSGSNSEHHIFRNILQTEEEGAEKNVSDPKFLNTGCVYMYAESVTIKVGSGNNGTNLTMPPQTTGSICDNGTTTLQLTFKSSDEVDITSAVIKFDFKNRFGSWTTNITMTLTGPKAPAGELLTYDELIEAPLNNSFNCGILRIRTKNHTNVVVTIRGFQVQPYGGGDKFSDSFDCVPFFTIPIWMGVFVSLLFIIIINTGVYALFSVHTMDRFDDPKGKTITVAVSGE